MTGTVIHFPSSTLTVDQAIEEARSQDLSPFIIIGLDPDDRVTVITSKTTHERANWLIDRAKRKLHDE